MASKKPRIILKHEDPSKEDKDFVGARVFKHLKDKVSPRPLGVEYDMGKAGSLGVGRHKGSKASKRDSSRKRQKYFGIKWEIKF